MRLATTLRLLLPLLALLLPATPAFPVPVQGETFSVEQPDGEIVQVRIWGDEYYRVVESLDGYTLAPDPKTGAACYARVTPDGSELVSTGVRAGRPVEGLALEKHLRIDPKVRDAIIRRARASQAADERELAAKLSLAPPSEPTADSGQVLGLLLLIDFSDDPATIPAAEIEAFCNEPGYDGFGNNGSVRDYFLDVSDGILDYTNHVAPRYYRALHEKVYYTDFTQPSHERARELILEALNDLEAGGYDFSRHDSNGDGLIDAINAYYAGEAQSTWATGLWPHSSTIEFSADGVDSYRYQISNLGEGPALGVFCHENGHLLCRWPDLYDYDFDSRGVGAFCLMATGCYSTVRNPAEPCAPLKHYSGWDDSMVLAESRFDLALPAGRNEFALVPHPTLATEYFMLENRHRAGRLAGAPADGLAIWHVDENGSNDNQEMLPESHYEIALLQADGYFGLELDWSGGDEGDLWPFDTSWATCIECTPNTVPSTRWWSGESSGLAVVDMGAPGPTMVVDVILEAGSNVRPTAAFETRTDHGYFPYRAQFLDASLQGDTRITGWLWDFGDGATSEERNPVHVYTEAGDYRASLTVSNYLGEHRAWGAPIEVRPDPGRMTIAAVQRYNPLSGAADTALEGWPVRVAGRVFIEPNTHAGRGFSVMDSTGGIQIDAPGAQFRLGDRVAALGRLQAIGGELRLTRAEVAGLGPGDPPEPVPLTPEEAMADYAHVGCFAGVTGLVVNLTADSFELAGEDARLLVRVDPATGIDLAGVTEGLPCRVFGALASDNGLRILMPRSQVDLYPEKIDEPPALTGPPGFVRIAPNPANPLTTIRLRVGKPARVELVIHDLQGRRVRTLLDETLTPAEYDLPWDGLDDHGAPVASAPYLARLRIGDLTQTRKLTLLK